MAWGGARIGAGRKPRLPVPVRVLDGREAFANGLLDLTAPPSDLPAEQRAVWTSYAPDAVQRGTLVASTVPGFRLLCELECKKRALEEKARAGGVSETRLYLQCAKQLETSLGRFQLTSFGKPMPALSTAAPDEHDAFFGGARVG